MRFQYSTINPSQNEFDSLPRLPLILHQEDRSVETVGLVASSAIAYPPDGGDRAFHLPL